MIRIGTRGSALALWQAERVRSLLADRGVPSDLVIIRSTGDAQHDRPVAELGAGAFTRELEEALLDRRIDAAVHSCKDLPSAVAPGLSLAAIPEREDPRDAAAGRRLSDLPPGSRVATSSPRRQEWIRRTFPGLLPVAVRGNVDTRLRKLDAGEFDALLLAMAGLKRLGLAGRVVEAWDVGTLVPPAGQGAIAVETRAGEESRAAAIDDPILHAAVRAERLLFQLLRAGCRTPIGAHAIVRPEGSVDLTVDLAGIRASGSGPNAETAAMSAALELRGAGAEAIIARWR
ncbi:MAG: hydroxymethylbilane synthase [Candidatus Brocadiae bacterium]|nr:hydroxymethylbilane synthase [Candidatus Brocadiia bacterium]